MIKVTLKDGVVKEFDAPKTVQVLQETLVQVLLTAKFRISDSL